MRAGEAWSGGMAWTGYTCGVLAIAFNWTRQKRSNEILNQNFCMSLCEREREVERVSQWMMSRPDIVDVLTNVSPFEALTLTAANTAACQCLPLSLPVITLALTTNSEPLKLCDNVAQKQLNPGLSNLQEPN